MSASTSTTTTTSLPPNTKTSAKANKLSKRIVLRLSPSVLVNFPSAQPVRKASRSKPPATSTSAAPIPKEPEPTLVESKPEPDASPAPNQPEEASTPVPGAAAKRKAAGPRLSGVKRSAPDGSDTGGVAKQKGKPGPKKRAKTDGDTNGQTPGGAPVSHHKLGPKANQGAINAGLRALDRSGKPCRKWARKGFQLKSFTGVAWDIGSWRTSRAQQSSFNGDVKSETTGSSDAKPDNGSSGMQSGQSNSGGDVPGGNASMDIASSPTPVVHVETPLAS